METLLMSITDDQAQHHVQAALIRERLGARPLVIVGLMGAGKSTIGKKVAHLLGLPFFDADNEIEAVSRMTIPELFETYGETEFRDLERRVIQRMLETGPMVLATGGGAYMNAQTREAIAAAGVSVWLKADLDLLMDRVSRRQNRPLLKNDNPRTVMQRLMAERYPVYALADMTVTSRDEKKEIIAQEVVEVLARYLGASDEAATGSIRS
ncbi:shikimate kinase [Phyllobacterium phragmitis]|uniref:Shikimate kinase n=2 Tax=Phyllobacterium phragmitis TaxID=2670329 RepID=A0ABQ0GU64_9HYPH